LLYHILDSTEVSMALGGFAMDNCLGIKVNSSGKVGRSSGCSSMFINSFSILLCTEIIALLVYYVEKTFYVLAKI